MRPAHELVLRRNYFTRRGKVPQLFYKMWQASSTSLQHAARLGSSTIPQNQTRFVNHSPRQDKSTRVGNLRSRRVSMGTLSDTNHTVCYYGLHGHGQSARCITLFM